MFSTAFPSLSSDLTGILGALSALTMVVGNLVAISQTNIKRLLAYSSIAHAGYAMIGLVAFNQLGATGVVFYLAAYIVTNLLAFGVVMAFSRVTGLENLEDYAGMSRRNPWLGLMMLAAFLSRGVLHGRHGDGTQPLLALTCRGCLARGDHASGVWQW